MKQTRKKSTVASAKAPRRRSKAAGLTEVTRPRHGFVLFREPNRKRVDVKPSESASVLMRKAARALEKPGISRSAIFPTGQPGLYAYSIYPKDPSKIIRESSSGKRTLGRFVRGRFKAI